MKVKVKAQTALATLYNPGETIDVFPLYDENGRKSNFSVVDGNGNIISMTDVEFPRKWKKNPKARNYA